MGLHTHDKGSVFHRHDAEPGHAHEDQMLGPMDEIIELDSKVVQDLVADRDAILEHVNALENAIEWLAKNGAIVDFHELGSVIIKLPKENYRAENFLEAVDKARR